MTTSTPGDYGYAKRTFREFASVMGGEVERGGALMWIRVGEWSVEFAAGSIPPESTLDPEQTPARWSANAIFVSSRPLTFKIQRERERLLHPLSEWVRLARLFEGPTLADVDASLRVRGKDHETIRTLLSDPAYRQLVATSLRNDSVLASQVDGKLPDGSQQYRLTFTERAEGGGARLQRLLEVCEATLERLVRIKVASAPR